MRQNRFILPVCSLALSGLLWPAAAENAPIPNFAADAFTGWIAGVPEGKSPTGQDFLPPESGPGPVTNDPAHPFVDDAAARRDGKQPTFRVADLSNPILLPWTREALRKQNERALAERAPLTPKERCWPIGVPGWVLYPVRPVYFLQRPKITWYATSIWIRSTRRIQNRHGSESRLAIMKAVTRWWWTP
jgi:hypothetical protein